MALYSRIGVVQNVGLNDRLLRTLLGWGVIGMAALDLVGGAQVGWHTYAILLAIYPLLTAILGWDPFYAVFGNRSCDISERNRCGTFPFEVYAALGKHPRCASDYDCHLPDTVAPGSKQSRR